MTRVRSSLTSATLLALAACSSSTEPVGNTLTALDARRVADAFAGIGAGSRGTLTLIDEETSACPKGGTLRITSLNPTAGGTERAAVVLSNCAVADSTGQVWTLNTLPRLDMTSTVTITDSTITSSTTTAGTLRVESSTTRGTCTTNARTDAVLRFAPPSTVRVRQSGTVCGQAIDSTWTEVMPK